MRPAKSRTGRSIHSCSTPIEGNEVQLIQLKYAPGLKIELQKLLYSAAFARLAETT